jgi:hypothetical protein
MVARIGGINKNVKARGVNAGQNAGQIRQQLQTYTTRQKKDFYCQILLSQIHVDFKIAEKLV